MREFYILTQDENFAPVLDYIAQRGFEYELHLNRTRFQVPEGIDLTEFLLRWSHCCPPVEWSN